MAFSPVGSLGTGVGSGAGTTIVITTPAVAEVGNLVVIVTACDNVQTTDGVTNEVSSVSDSAGGNTWIKAGEYCNGQGGAGNGVVASVWYSVLANQIPSGGTITITLANSVATRAASAWEFTKGAGSTVSVAGSVQTNAGDAADPASMTISGLASKEYLFIRSCAVEINNSENFTPTASYTEFTEANQGFMASNGEFRILTGTGDTSDPSTVSDQDNASVYFALEEISTANTGNFFPFF